MALMTTNNNSKKFEDYKKQLANLSGNKGGYEEDPRVLSMKDGFTYRLRLLYFENEDPASKRKGPFLELNTHSCKDENGKTHTIICPVSFHGKAGYKMCKTCTALSAFWNSDNPADKQLYEIHKRKLHCYAIVYVISDPSNPENNGRVKKWHYGKKIKKFFDQEIFGLKTVQSADEVSDAEESTEESVGPAAFNITDGYDFIVAVTKDGKYNNYSTKFARKATTINVDLSALEAEIKALDFDNYKAIFKTYEDDINAYYDKYILNVRNSSAPIASDNDGDSETQHVNSTMTELMTAATEISEEVSKPAQKTVKQQPKQVEQQKVVAKPAVAPQAVQAKPVESAPSITDDMDIDAFINELESNN